MSTIGDHLSNIRHLIQQIQDDSKYTDSFLYSILVKASALLLKQKTEKNHFVSDFLYSTFCMELEKTKSHDCACIPYGCDVLRTVHQVPSTITARNKDMLEVLDLTGRSMSRRTEQQIISDRLDPVKSGKPVWFMKNRRIYLANTLSLKVIQVRGLFEDLTEWEDKQYCSDEDNTPPCIDIWEAPMPVDQDLSVQMYQITLQLLQMPLQVPDDQTVDSNPQIKQ